MKDLASTLSGAVMPGDEASAFVRSQLNSGEPQLPQSDPNAGFQTAKGWGQFLAGLAPGGGIADAAGQLGAPSIRENWKQGNYGTAALQGLGVAGDALQGVPGLGTIMGAAVKAPAAAKMGMFLGAGAKIADKVKLAKAQQMFESGAAREAIWDATGWFKGVDGNWRFEIPDDKSFFKGVKDSKTVGDALTHDELYKNYPAAADVALYYNPNSKARGNGTFMPHPLYKHGGAIELTGPTDAGSTTLHELQHYIQEQEDFARGGMPEPIKKGNPGWDIYKQNPAITLPAMTREQFVATLPDDPRISIPGSWMKYQQALDKKNKSIVKQAKAKASHEGYRRLAGEVESRTTQKRIDMPADERKARYPWLDYDVPEEQQIVRFK